MAEHSKDAIGQLDAFETVGVADRLMRAMYSAGATAPTAAEVPDALRKTSERLIEHLQDERVRETALTPATALEIARAALSMTASDPVLAPLLAKAVEDQANDESMNAVEILAVGAAVSLVLTAATIQFEWKGGRLRSIGKRALGDQAIMRLVGLLERILLEAAPSEKRQTHENDRLDEVHKRLGENSSS